MFANNFDKANAEKYQLFMLCWRRRLDALKMNAALTVGEYPEDPHLVNTLDFKLFHTEFLGNSSSSCQKGTIVDFQ